MIDDPRTYSLVFGLFVTPLWTGRSKVKLRMDLIEPSVLDWFLFMVSFLVQALTGLL